MSQRGGFKFAGRLAMQEGDRAECRLARRTSVEHPSELLRNRQTVKRGQLSKDIVRMLAIEQRQSFIRFPSLKQLGKSAMRRGERFGGKHFAKLQIARAQRTLLHQHQPVGGFRLAYSALAALLVV